MVAQTELKCSGSTFVKANIDNLLEITYIYRVLIGSAATVIQALSSHWGCPIAAEDMPLLALLNRDAPSRKTACPVARKGVVADDGQCEMVARRSRNWHVQTPKLIDRNCSNCC
ncbi:hypothetical protein [Parasphingorhabdus sp.]|uniref:hypothetical protein n=1 Tax=Parasphingorhabdus sp. TaxID=2709688 RepID=UPI002B27243C|nr:hypothetical protein [Parasphingorhabdus sp.]